ncbi:MAG: hypothetical protein IPP73_20065 [Chitinophagaceae bacterium]|nr:hypothetical protein [Chitinophagaceae bacterium]
MPEVLAHIDFYEAIDYYKKQVAKGHDKLAYNNIKDFLTGAAKDIPGITIEAARLKEVKRNWQLMEEEEKKFF